MGKRAGPNVLDRAEYPIALGPVEALVNEVAFCPERIVQVHRRSIGRDLTMEVHAAVVERRGKADKLFRGVFASQSESIGMNPRNPGPKWAPTTAIGGAMWRLNSRSSSAGTHNSTC